LGGKQKGFVDRSVLKKKSGQEYTFAGRKGETNRCL